MNVSSQGFIWPCRWPICEKQPGLGGGVVYMSWDREFASLPTPSLYKPCFPRQLHIHKIMMFLGMVAFVCNPLNQENKAEKREDRLD